MSVVEIYSLTLAIISSFTALISLAILFWDHFYDDKILTRQVQDYYDAIEGLIFTYYKAYNLRSLFKSNPKLDEDYTQFEREYVFYMGKTNTFFEEFSKYFGLAKYGSFLISFTSQFSCNTEGEMFELGHDLHRKAFAQIPMFKIESGIYVFGENIFKIDNYLEAIRKNGDDNYSKRLFRKKLKPKRYFTLLSKITT